LEKRYRSADKNAYGTGIAYMLVSSNDIQHAVLQAMLHVTAIVYNTSYTM